MKLSEKSGSFFLCEIGYIVLVFVISFIGDDMTTKKLTEEQIKIIKRLIEKGILTENQIKRLKKQGVIN